MQRGLVHYAAGEGGCAVALVGEAHPVEPGGPSGGEVPLEADFVTSRRVMVVSGCVWLAHGAPSFVAWSHSRLRCGEAASPHVVIAERVTRETNQARLVAWRAIPALSPMA